MVWGPGDGGGDSSALQVFPTLCSSGGHPAGPRLCLGVAMGSAVPGAGCLALSWGLGFAGGLGFRVTRQV